MPTARNYKAGSVIYFDGEHGEEIYILKTGKIVLATKAIESGEEEKEQIKAGEFFGVKSILGKYPREETATVIAPSVVIVMSQLEFESTILTNFPLVMKMLKVFSNQLRRIGKKVKKMLETEEPKLPATELYLIGEYYYKKAKKQQAIYAFKSYIKNYPNGQYVDQAMERIKSAESGVFSSGSIEPAGESSPSMQPDAQAGAQAGEEAGDGTEPAELTGEGMDVPKRYYEGLSLFSQEKIEEALASFKSIEAVKKFKDETTAKFAEKSQYEAGRCLLKLEKFHEAVETYSNMIKKYPRTEMMKEALFNIGFCYEKQENLQKAMNFYNKVVGMPPRNAINTKAKKAIEVIQSKL